MNPEVSKLIDDLKADAEYLGCNYELIQERIRLASVILQAVFDPENRPSQFGADVDARADRWGTRKP